MSTGISNGVNVEVPGQSNIASNNLGVTTDEAVLNIQAQLITQKFSNLGSINPYKGPSPRTLFYDGGFRQPDKYGAFLMYHIGNNENDFIAQYYESEKSKYNQRISPVNSKNPSAAQLVKLSTEIDLIIKTNKETSSNPENGIIGGACAPYNWKDFLYCKYYGSIPNNYMVTLRRFQTPVKDNFSLPEGFKNQANTLLQGVGRPVAQAITWWGGNTGNSLNDIISFTSGLNWKREPQSALAKQEEFDKGLFNNVLASYVRSALQIGGVDQESADNAENIINLSAELADPESTAERERRAYTLRDKAEEDGGPLSNFIWVSVDTVDNTYIRERGLSWEDKTITLKFHYDLATVASVNSKAAMLDILGNLLGLATNYGQFLTPAFRYNSEFAPINFPGGNAGLNEFYLDPLKYWEKFSVYLSNLSDKIQKNASGDVTTVGQEGTSPTVGSQDSQPDPNKPTGTTSDDVESIIRKILRKAGTKSLIDSIQMPLSFMTGAPIGEWHLVVGNPMNPIAMIGNLICDGVTIDFSEKLGPDDFPSELTATFTLKHARDRERGEIESMFNRGDGRLYETTLPTSASSQSNTAFADSTGTLRSDSTPTNVVNGKIYTPSVSNNQAPPQQ